MPQQNHGGAAAPLLFIADLHLGPHDAATADAFAAFLQGPARQAQALFILGDLFEYWVGDDQLDEDDFGRVGRELAALSRAGVALYFMPGNRDFLPGRRFARETGATLLPDPWLLEHAGERIVLAHGDAYCLDDPAYQRFRRIIRSRLIRWLWLVQPRSWRHRRAEKIRAASQQRNRSKDYRLLDVTPAAIDAALAKANARLMIHGHTHRPACHQHANGVRWVLPDWHQGQGGYLCLQDGQISAHDWPAKTGAG